MRSQRPPNEIALLAICKEQFGEIAGGIVESGVKRSRVATAGVDADAVAEGRRIHGASSSC